MSKLSVLTNNLFNIRYNSSNNFLGIDDKECQVNGFAKFVNTVYSVRAFLLLVYNYNHLYKIKTIEDFITRFAPPSENNTTGYIKFVCDRMSTVKYTDLNVFKPLQMYDFASAVCQFETNTSLTHSLFDEGYGLFLHRFIVPLDMFNE